MRLSAASDPSTGRSHLRIGRISLDIHSDKAGDSNNAASTASMKPA